MSTHEYAQDSLSSSSRITQCLFPSVAVSSDKRDQENPFPPRALATPASQRFETGQPDVTIDMLQDDVLLEIFDSYRRLVSRHASMWKWQKLLHICRRGRYIVLASPRRLNLQIECDRRTPTRKSLDIWPPFPISLSCYPGGRRGTRGNHNIFAALQRHNRISQVNFSGITYMELEQFAAAMDEPFPILTDLFVRGLEMDVDPSSIAKLPDSFLGGSAPRLQSFVLEGTAFPALPNLVLSASHFQYLHLLDIPHAGYIPPELMVTFLLPLHNLKCLTIKFTFPESCPFQMSHPPLTHAVLPSLTGFQFNGPSEYLVDLIARIDAPMLDSFRVTFFSDVIPNISQLHKFIDRTDKLKTFIQAKVYLRPWEVQAIFNSPSNLGLNITCEVSDYPLGAMTRLYEQLLTIPSQVEKLELYEESWDELEASNEEEWQVVEDLDDPLWLQLLNPFVSVKSLCVSNRLEPFITYVLDKLTVESVTEVLPALNNLFFEDFRPSGFEEKNVESFVSMRQLSGHPVIVQRWERKLGFGSSLGGSPLRSCGHLVFFSDCTPPQLESQYVQCPAPHHRVWPCLHVRRYSTMPTCCACIFTGIRTLPNELPFPSRRSDKAQIR